MTFYIGLVDQNDGHWGAWFPDLPGCFAAGASMDALFADAVQAIRVWVQDAAGDGDEPPAPRSFDAIAQDTAVMATARQDNATFIQVPLVLDSRRSVRANISLDAGLLDAIDVAAKRLKLTRSAFLASAAQEKITRGV